MSFDRRQLLVAGASMMAGGCALRVGGAGPNANPAIPSAPLQISKNNLTKITVCTRPFRPAGPRLEAERVDGKLLVHNYGHGGSGWSLSWGCAADAAALALAGEARTFAIIGAGVMGLTTALRLVETGAAVTIYAKEFPSETRSARATGVWSPSSRIGLGGAVDANFAARWEKWARASYAAHEKYVGRLGAPVEFEPLYGLSNANRAPQPGATRDFLHLDRRVRDMVPARTTVPDGAHAFPVDRVRAGLNMTFNVAAYADHLTRSFLLRGGRMIRRDFPDRRAVLALQEKTIVNCTGYGAKTLWDASDLAPVRGQINWMNAQPNALYAFFHGNVFVVSRRDGVVVQYVGPNDDYGYGNDDETPDRDEMEAAIAEVAPLFA